MKVNIFELAINSVAKRKINKIKFMTDTKYRNSLLRLVIDKAIKIRKQISVNDNSKKIAIKRWRKK